MKYHEFTTSLIIFTKMFQLTCFKRLQMHVQSVTVEIHLKMTWKNHITKPTHSERKHIISIHYYCHTLKYTIII